VGEVLPVKVAVAVALLPESVRLHVMPLHAPDQPEKTKPLFRVTVNVTGTPSANDAEQVPLLAVQLVIPGGLEVTVPPELATTVIRWAATPHTFAEPAPPQVAGLVQAPHATLVRVEPQLSAAVTEPQFFPSREQNVVSDSGVQTQTFDPLQVSVPEHVPHPTPVRVVPQLSAAVTEPQFFPSREQKVVSDSGVHTQTLDGLQVSVPLQAPHETPLRVAPQLSVPLTEPQFFPRREQNVVSDSGVQTQTFVELQESVPLQAPHETPLRVVPQLSVPFTTPQFFPRREQNVVSDSGVQTQTLAVQTSVPMQVPQVAVRPTPQLSSALSAPQFFPRRAQNATLVSAAQPHTFGTPEPPQL
jgi:hypothetical protein